MHLCWNYFYLGHNFLVNLDAAIVEFARITSFWGMSNVYIVAAEQSDCVVKVMVMQSILQNEGN